MKQCDVTVYPNLRVKQLAVGDGSFSVRLESDYSATCINYARSSDKPTGVKWAYRNCVNVEITESNDVDAMPFLGASEGKFGETVITFGNDKENFSIMLATGSTFAEFLSDSDSKIKVTFAQ